MIRSQTNVSQQNMAQEKSAITAVKSFIEEGSYSPGDRLPPEREIIEALGIGRTAVRRALSTLQREGQIWRHVGKGTFLSDTTVNSQEEPASKLAEQLTPIKIMRARLCIEPALAREAAVNATSQAVAVIHNAKERALTASSWSSYEAADDEFHRAIAKAADNLLLLSLFDSLNAVRRSVAWGTVIRTSDRPAENHPSFREHKAIVEAIEARHPKAAYNAMQRHIRSVSARLFGEV